MLDRLEGTVVALDVILLDDSSSNNSKSAFFGPYESLVSPERRQTSTGEELRHIQRPVTIS